MEIVEDRRSHSVFRDALQREIFGVEGSRERLHDLLLNGAKLGLISVERARKIRASIDGGADCWNAAIMELGR